MSCEDRQAHAQNTHRRVCRQFQWVPEYLKFRSLIREEKPANWLVILLQKPLPPPGSFCYTLPSPSSPAWTKHPFLQTLYNPVPCMLYHTVLWSQVCFLSSPPASLRTGHTTQLASNPQHRTGPGSGINKYLLTRWPNECSWRRVTLLLIVSGRHLTERNTYFPHIY